jgi:hypothetical protein
LKIFRLNFNQTDSKWSYLDAVSVKGNPGHRFNMSQEKPSARGAEKLGPECLLPDADAVHRKLSEDLVQTDTERVTSAEGGGHRAYSPSSVSSAASTRPLEWDSGADVGYLLQNEERQLANAIKKLGLGLPSSSRSDMDLKVHNSQ